MDHEQKRRWIAHCERMAEATYAIADWCDDPAMMATYVALGAKWVQMAAAGPASPAFGGQAAGPAPSEMAA